MNTVQYLQVSDKIKNEEQFTTYCIVLSCHIQQQEKYYLIQIPQHNQRVVKCFLG